MQELWDVGFAPFDTWVDITAFIIYLLVFPIYHGVYPWLVRLSPKHTAKGRIDLYRRSWIETIISNREVVQGAQQTRNLTMVASFLASSALILLGVTGNILLTGSGIFQELPGRPAMWERDPLALEAKLYLLMLVFSVTFMYFMACLRHLGHFVLIIGADPALIEREENVSAVDYVTAVINLASNRYTLGTRCFYSALPLFVWLFSSWLFLAVTLFSALKFVGVTDFAHHMTRQVRRAKHLGEV